MTWQENKIYCLHELCEGLCSTDCVNGGVCFGCFCFCDAKSLFAFRKHRIVHPITCDFWCASEHTDSRSIEFGLLSPLNLIMCVYFMEIHEQDTYRYTNFNTIPLAAYNGSIISTHISNLYLCDHFEYTYNSICPFFQEFFQMINDCLSNSNRLSHNHPKSCAKARRRKKMFSDNYVAFVLHNEVQIDLQSLTFWEEDTNESLRQPIHNSF